MIFGAGVMKKMADLIVKVKSDWKNRRKFCIVILYTVFRLEERGAMQVFLPEKKTGILRD